jgi:hypothetical protein
VPPCPPRSRPAAFRGPAAAIADPRHERHEEPLEWRGPFYPEAFDAKKATKEMRKVSDPGILPRDAPGK